MMDLIIGCGLGIALRYLIDKFITEHNKKFNPGEEEYCKNCCYKSAVMETISDVEKDT